MIELSNTPGIYYALAYWLASWVYVSVNPRRVHGLRRVLVQGGFLVVMMGTAYATRDVPLYLWLPSISVIFVLCGLCIAACCEMPRENILYFTIRSIMLGEFAASLEWQLFYYAVTSLWLRNTAWTNCMFMLLSHGVVFGIMFWLEHRYQEENRKLQVTPKKLLSVLLLFIAVFAISNMSYIISDSPFSSTLSHDLFIVRTISDLGGVGILYSYHMQLHELTNRLELEKLHAMTMMQYASYKISEESIAVVNQKYHDLKHHIQLLRYETTSEEKCRYLDRMEEEIQAYEAKNKTGNKILDAILTVKSLECQRKKISITCVADGKALDFMDPMDLSTLFGNALDNAIESVQKIPEEDHRLIQVQVQRNQQFVRVRIRNSYSGEIKLRGGIPITTKKDQRFHGFGIRSMQHTVNKYGGVLSIQAQDGWFELGILFPIEHNDENGTKNNG